MVSLEELLERVQQAETETDRQWVLLELQIAQMPANLASMLWAAAIPHFFDDKVLVALRPELASEAEALYEDLKKLTFVEDFPGHGSNIHELTRDVLLGRLWHSHRDDFLNLSRRAANFFFDQGQSLEEKVEFCYHEILDTHISGDDRLLDQVVDWWNHYENDQIQSVIQLFLEHQNHGRLTKLGQGFLLHLKGLLKSYLGQYREAEELLGEAQAIYQLLDFENFRYQTTLLRDLAVSQLHQGHYQEAEPVCEEVLELSQEKFGADHLDTSISLNNLATLYEFQGRYREAEPLYQQALKIRRSQLGPDHPDIAASLNNLAGLYTSQGRYGEAEPLYQQALETRRSQLGPNHPDIAASLNNLAELYRAQGRYGEAEPLYQQALEIQRSQLGPDHPHTATSLNNLALLYASQGRYGEAEPLYQQALETLESKLGEDHPHTITCLKNLAKTCRKQEEYTKAISLLERWKALEKSRQNTRNQEFAIQVRTLGKLYEKEQEFQDAARNYEEALSILNYVLGPQHPQTLILKGEIKRLKKQMKKT